MSLNPFSAPDCICVGASHPFPAVWLRSILSVGGSWFIVHTGCHNNIEPLRGNRSKGNPFFKLGCFSWEKENRDYPCHRINVQNQLENALMYGVGLQYQTHVSALTHLPPQPASLSSPVLIPICTVHQRHPPQLSKTGFPCPSPGDGWGGRSSPHSPEFTHRISHAGTSKS